MLIKYRYAYNLLDKIVDVTQLKKQELKNEDVFKCLGCNNILIPVLGEKRQKHFRHKIDINCSFETYLHKLAKTIFYELYNNCLLQNEAYTIEIEQEKICNYYEAEFLFSCNLNTVIQTFDLTKYFLSIRLEQKEDSFIPDLLLISQTGDKLFIEIAVTHFLSREKVNSGYRLIEIDIKNEDDLEIINNKHLARGEKVKFFNFKALTIRDFCRGQCHNQFKPYSYCNLEYEYFVVFNNGKSALLSLNLDEIDNLHKNQKIKYGELIEASSSNLIKSDRYLKLVIESFFNDRGIKNCFLCRYHGISYSFDYPIFCKFIKKNCNSNEAANCEYYRPDTKVFPTFFD